MRMTQEKCSTRLRVARGRAGYTVERLAALSGISATQITNIESGSVKRPRVQTLTALADALGVSAADFISAVEEPAEAAS